jgi:hypothetical protein
MRVKIGVFGSELTAFGGPFPKNAAAIRLRFYAKNIFDKTVHPGPPARKEIRAVIEKAEVPVAAQECTFEIALLNQSGLAIGEKWEDTSSRVPRMTHDALICAMPPNRARRGLPPVVRYAPQPGRGNLQSTAQKEKSRSSPESGFCYRIHAGRPVKEPGQAGNRPRTKISVTESKLANF